MDRHTFCVAVDGSDVSYKALRMALALMEKTDTLLVIHVTEVTSGGSAQEAHVAGKEANVHGISKHTLEANATVEALKFHIQPHHVTVVVADLGEGERIAEKIVGLAHKRAKHLAIGASGHGAEQVVAPGGAIPLGSVAEFCLERSRVPVILVRGIHGKFDFQDAEAVAGTDPRPHLSIGVAVRGRNACRTPLPWMAVSPPCLHSCARLAPQVDGSNVSKRAFDKAVAFSRPADEVRVFHVESSFSNASRDQVRPVKRFYDMECAKVASTRTGVACSFEVLPAARGSVSDAVAAKCASAEINLLVIGSIELADVSKSIFLGSVAGACARHSNTNVCVIKGFAS